MSASIIDRIWGPNLIRQSLETGVAAPVQHIDRIRHQLSEILLEAVENNDPTGLEYAASELDRFASQGADVTDPLVRSTAYIAHQLGWDFLPQYHKFTSDHSRRESYFATVFEHASSLPSLTLFDRLCAVCHEYNFNGNPPSQLTRLENQPVFKIIRSLCLRNELQRIVNCAPLLQWLQNAFENTPIVIRASLQVAAKYGASEVFAWGLARWLQVKNKSVLSANFSIIDYVSCQCVDSDQMHLFEQLFNAFPSQRQHMFGLWDYRDRTGQSRKNLDEVLSYMQRLTPEQLQHFTSDKYTPEPPRRRAVRVCAQNLLQRQLLLQNIPSTQLLSRRKV